MVEGCINYIAQEYPAAGRMARHAWRTGEYQHVVEVGSSLLYGLVIGQYNTADTDTVWQTIV
jgi:hypothetical protein